MQEIEEQQRISRERDELTKTLDDYFSGGVQNKKFVDVSRIPLICQDISVMHGDIAEIKDSIKWVTRLIIGAVLLATIAMILK